MLSVFFLDGLSTATPGSNGMVLWVMIFVVVIVILTGGWYLKSIDKLGYAKAVLSVIAVPCILFLLFMFSTLVGGNGWK